MYVWMMGARAYVCVQCAWYVWMVCTVREAPLLTQVTLFLSSLPPSPSSFPSPSFLHLLSPLLLSPLLLSSSQMHHETKDIMQALKQRMQSKASLRR